MWCVCTCVRQSFSLAYVYIDRVYRAEHDKNTHSATQFPTHPISDDCTRHQPPNYDDYPFKPSESPCSPSLSTPSPLFRTQSLQLGHELDNRTIFEMQSAAHNSHSKVVVSGTATQAWCLLQGGGLQEEGAYSHSLLLRMLCILWPLLFSFIVCECDRDDYHNAKEQLI